MKAKYWTVWLAGWFFLLANPAWAEMAGETTKSYIGVRLNQVPDVLRKHLKLDDNRGLLIQNIQLGSPADKAGLEKDDIIISWNGQPVTSYQEFVDQVQQAGVGTEITLDVIHNGDVKIIPVTLEPYQKLDSWKYPAGPEGFGRLQPGRVFRLQPDKQNWEQIPFGQVPEMKDYFKRFFQQKHSYKSADGEMNLEITIEGDPHDPNAKIKIEDRKERTHYETAADQIDQLPEKYRQPVRQILEEAQKSEFDYDFDWPQWQEYYEDPFNRQNWPPEWLRNRSDESMSNQMQDLMERMGQLEKKQQELLERMERFEKK